MKASASFLIVGFTVLLAPMAADTVTQVSTTTAEAITVGSGGYALNFSIQWSCDDAPQHTTSAPGQIQLIDANGNLVGRLQGSVSNRNASISLAGAGAGSVSSVSVAIDETGANGTPADGYLDGTWNITGVAPGSYTLIFWSIQETAPSQPASTIWTSTSAAAGGGPVGSPGPVVPPAPPSIVISSPSSAMAGQPVDLSATATRASSGNPLQTVILEVSSDGGSTWTEIAATPTAANPSDTEGNPYAFAQPGTASIRARVYDTAGLEGTAAQTLTVNPPPPPPQPPSAAIWADNPSIAFGQTTTIHATFSAGANDILANSNIDHPEGTPAGPDQDGSSQATRSHPFTATSIGNYTFYARINTAHFPWATYGTATVNVVKADQAGVTISPATAVVTSGQSVAFSASGGVTGNYGWSGSAAGGGSAQTVVFTNIGTATVTVQDLGDANHNPSPAATATVTVLPSRYTLSVTSGPGGAVAGGGSYPANTVATAVATADGVDTFSGWTGDVTSGSPSLPILMNADHSIMAHFTPRLAQTIFLAVPPSQITTAPPIHLSATASSGLPVGFILTGGPAILSGSLLTLNGVTGLVSVTAVQPGNAQFLPASPIPFSFTVGLPPPGVILTDDSARTTKADRNTKVDRYTSTAPAHP